MAKPTRISELNNAPGGPLASDQIPIARGAGASGQTYKVLANQLLTNFLSAVDTPTIDLDFDTTTGVLKANATTAVTNASAFNVVDSPTVDLNWNSSTRTLSANVNDSSITNAKIAFDGGAFGFRNKIINGGMEIDQRKAGATHTITAAAPQVYSLDRWYGFATGASTTHQRFAITNIPGLSYALRITGAAGNTNTWAAQRIESSTSSSLVGLSATLSFYAASNTLTQLQVYWGRPGSSTPDDWSLAPNPPVSTGSQNFSITSTLTRYQATFIVPQEARRGFYIQFHSSPLLAGQTIDITGVQLEEGPTATPFEHRPIGTELALCQRYYEKSYPINIAPGTNTQVAGNGGTGMVGPGSVDGGSSSTGALQEFRPFKVEKRSTPVVRSYSSTGIIDRYDLNQGTYTVTTFSPSITLISNTSFHIATNTSTLKYGFIYHYTADAEL